MNYLEFQKVRQLCLAFTVLIVSGFVASQAQMPAGANRPASVPEGFLITPLGYFHPTCVKQLAEGDVIRQDERAIKHADGSFDSMPVCAFSHFTPNGQQVAANESVSEDAALTSPDADAAAYPPPAIAHAWVEALYLKGNSTFAKLSAAWTVPPAPTSHDGQTIFFFPGLEDYTSANTTILQPVLGWNASAPFKNVWSLASWNCCANGIVWHSAAIPTAAGHKNFGAMQHTCPAGTRRCGSWNIVTTDLDTGKTTKLTKTSSDGLSFNWAFPGVLEVYNVQKCSDYPQGSAGSEQFSQIRLLDYNFNVVSPHWVLWKRWPGMTPQCGYGGSGAGSVVTLKF